MQKAPLLVLGIAGLTIGAMALVRERQEVAPPSLAAEQVESSTAGDAPPEASPPPTPAASDAVPPVTAPAAVPDLPTVEVKPRAVHTVPTDEPPIPKVTLFDRNGKEIATRQASLPTYVPPAPPPPIVPISGLGQAA